MGRVGRALVLSVVWAFGCGDSKAAHQSGPGLGGASGMGGLGGAGGKAPGAAPQCGSAVNGGAPAAASECAVVARAVDPTFTCGSADCAVARAFDLTCGYTADSPSISATADGALILAGAVDLGLTVEEGRLMTVGATEARVEDVGALENPYPLLAWQSALATTASGTASLFATLPGTLGLLRGSEGTWSTAPSFVLDSANPAATTILSGVALLDEERAAVLLWDQTPRSARLVTWDGSCWASERIDAIGSRTMALAKNGRDTPWVASLASPVTDTSTVSICNPCSATIYLRSPSGGVHDLAALAGVAPTAKDDSPLRMLPGGLHATEDTPPLVAARFSDGLRLFYLDPASGWTSTLVPMVAPTAGTNDCPSTDRVFDLRADPCNGLTSCKAQVNGTSSGFDLVRTEAGQRFAVWVEYSSSGTYGLSKWCVHGELPFCSCSVGGGTGTGTAELVVARVTDAEPVISRFRFDMGGASMNLTRDVVAATRGETLLVAATFSGDVMPALTYVEIDSTKLP